MFQIIRVRQELPSSHGAAAVAHASGTRVMACVLAMMHWQEESMFRGAKACSKRKRAHHALPSSYGAAAVAHAIGTHVMACLLAIHVSWC